MSDTPNRSRLSLPLKNINARYDTDVSEGANIGSRPTQQKLIKGLSTPAVYFVSTPFDAQFPSSSSNTLKKSRSCPFLNRAQSISQIWFLRNIFCIVENTVFTFVYTAKNTVFHYSGHDLKRDGEVFGVPSSKSYQLSIDALKDQKWSCRRLRFICRHYGNAKDIMMRALKSQSMFRNNYHSDVASILDDLSDVPSPSKSITPQSEIREAVFMTSSASTAETFSRNKSIECCGSQLSQQCLERRDSVMKMVSDRISSIIQRGTLRPEKVSATAKRGRSISGSFAPFSVRQTGNISHIRTGDVFAAKNVLAVVKGSSENHNMMNSSEPKRQNEKEIETFLFKENCSIIHFSSEVEATALVPMPRKVIGQKEPPLSSDLKKYGTTSTVKSRIQAQTVIEHEVVEDKVYVFYGGRTNPLHIHRCQELWDKRFSSITRFKESYSEDDPLGDGKGNFRKKVGKMDGFQAQKTQLHCSKEEKSTSFACLRNAFSSPKEWLLQNIQAADEKTTKKTIATCRNVRKRMLDTICSELKSKKYYVSHRRHFGSGFGIWRKYFQRTYRNDIYRLNEDTYIDCRPFFTYWITTVQILVTIGRFGLTERTADVLHTTVTLKRVSIYVQQNVWFGPKFADLIHLGAKFTPCMREDPKIFEQVKADHMEENKTGCCIYNDGTGCFQTGQSTCPSLIATLARWKEDRPGPENRISGAVCGQDPRYCEDPVSVKPYEWPDDITQWPICKQRTLFVPENVMHMQCEITGRPCCIQLHGQCRITTRDYCDFVEGYFHENATLCSQVSCLSEICGMLPFLRKNRPDQWYRLLTPLFLHAGVIHCVLTIFIQILYMRDLEKLLGWARMALLYMISGIGGYLAGAILFLTRQPEVGPAGSHIGMFAAMYVDVLYSWNLLERPWHAVVQLSLFTLALFILGTLPWVDNWAHLFAVLPYIQTKRHNRIRRLVIVITSLSTALGLFILLLAMFYWPSSFSCIEIIEGLLDKEIFCSHERRMAELDVGHYELWSLA
ncbi:Rhomboid-like protein [Dirofilaria immitis]|nr:Rhomboid-like protein [Dirofilaria immitis]